VAFEVTMSDIEDAYHDLGVPVTSCRFMVSVSAHIMIVKGFRRLSASQQKKIDGTIRSLITAFLGRLPTSA